MDNHLKLAYTILIPPAFPSDFTTPPPLVKVARVTISKLEAGTTKTVSYYITEIWGQKVEPRQNTTKLEALRNIYSPPALRAIKEMQKKINPLGEYHNKLQSILNPPALQVIRDVQKNINPLSSMVNSLLNYENTYIALYHSIDIYNQNSTGKYYNEVVRLKKELTKEYKKAQSKKSKKQLLKEIEQLQNKQNKQKQKNKKLKASLSSTENENKALVNALGSLQENYDKAMSDAEALPPPMASQPQPKKPKVLTLDSDLHTYQIRRIHKYGNEIFIATFEQWQNLFSSNIQPMQPIKLRLKTKLKAGTTLMDLRLFIDELKERSLINIRYPNATIEKTKAFSFEGSPVIAKQLKIDSKRGMYPNTKNCDKVQAIFEALRKPPNKE